MHTPFLPEHRKARGSEIGLRICLIGKCAVEEAVWKFYSVWNLICTRVPFPSDPGVMSI